ncbi:MAG: SigE family RNA polymerase sigma factor [Propionibacteriaceae bacterium]
MSTRETATEGISRLYESHWAGVVRLVWLLLHDQQAAEDVAQDAYIATYRNWDRLRNEEAAVAYLRRCAVNGARSVQRHLMVVRRETQAEGNRAEATGRLTAPGSDEAALMRLDSDQLMAALATLPGRQREVIVLRYYSDLSEAQIAEALDISPGSVKTHAYRGLRALRERMEVSA